MLIALHALMSTLSTCHFTFDIGLLTAISFPLKWEGTNAELPATRDKGLRVPGCFLEGDFVCSELGLALLPNHIGSGAPAPLGLSSLPLRYIHFHYSIFEFHFTLLHSNFIYTSTCCPSSLR